MWLVCLHNKLPKDLRLLVSKRSVAIARATQAREFLPFFRNNSNYRERIELCSDIRINIEKYVYSNISVSLLSRAKNCGCGYLWHWVR